MTSPCAPNRIVIIALLCASCGGSNGDAAYPATSDPCTIQLTEHVDLRKEVTQIAHGQSVKGIDSTLIAFEQVLPDNQKCAFTSRLLACCKGHGCDSQAEQKIADVTARACEPPSTPQTQCMTRCEVRKSSRVEIMRNIVAMCIDSARDSCTNTCTGLGRDDCPQICDPDHFLESLQKTNRKYWLEQKCTDHGWALSVASEYGKCRETCVAQ